MKESHLQWLRGLKLGLLFLLLPFSMVLHDSQGNPPILEMEGALPCDLVSVERCHQRGPSHRAQRREAAWLSPIQSENEVTGCPFYKWLNKRPRESLLLSYSWKCSHLQRSHSLACCAEAKRPAPQSRRADARKVSAVLTLLTCLRWCFSPSGESLSIGKRNRWDFFNSLPFLIFFHLWLNCNCLSFCLLWVNVPMHRNYSSSLLWQVDCFSCRKYLLLTFTLKGLAVKR